MSGPPLVTIMPKMDRVPTWTVVQVIGANRALDGYRLFNEYGDEIRNVIRISENTTSPGRTTAVIELDVNVQMADAAPAAKKSRK